MDRIAVIMAGGTGTRFWPMSRRERPKQVISLEDDQTMLEDTIDRLSSVYEHDGIYVVTSDEHRAPVAEVCSDIPDENVLGEPEGRDTAPCVGWAALVAREEFGPGTEIGVFPADHKIEPLEDFSAAVESASRAAGELEGIVTFGIRPDFPSSGYGYIEYSEAESSEISDFSFHRVEQFTEKPSRSKARDFLSAGNYLWNSGMFFWTADFILSEIERYMPDLRSGLSRICESWQKTSDWEEAARRHYSSLPETSVDYGILENSDSVWTLPVDFDWSDLGTWDALENILAPDDSGNVKLGDSLTVDSSDNVIVSSEGPFVACVGVEDHVVVSTGDAVLVCDRKRAEDVKKLVRKLEDEGGEELL